MFFILLAVALFLVDISIKRYINRYFDDTKEEELFQGRIKLRKQYNYGAAMNLLEGRKKLIIFVSSVVMSIVMVMFVLMVPKRRNYALKAAYAFMLGGGASNLYDRIVNGSVTDYFSFNGRAPKKLKKIVFNLGDLFIFFGAFLFLLKEMVFGG